MLQSGRRIRTEYIVTYYFGILRTGRTAAADSRNATTAGESACSFFINTSHRRRIILRVCVRVFLRDIIIIVMCVGVVGGQRRRSEREFDSVEEFPPRPSTRAAQTNRL